MPKGGPDLGRLDDGLCEEVVGDAQGLEVGDEWLGVEGRRLRVHRGAREREAHRCALLDVEQHVQQRQRVLAAAQAQAQPVTLMPRQGGRHKRMTSADITYLNF